MYRVADVSGGVHEVPIIRGAFVPEEIDSLVNRILEKSIFFAQSWLPILAEIPDGERDEHRVLLDVDWHGRVQYRDVVQYLPTQFHG